MQLNIRRKLLRQGKNTQVRHQDAVHPYAVQITQIIRQSIYIAVMREDIDRHVYLLAQTMGEADCLPQLLPGKIPSESTQPKRLAP